MAPRQIFLQINNGRQRERHFQIVVNYFLTVPSHLYVPYFTTKPSKLFTQIKIVQLAALRADLKGSGILTNIQLH